MRANLWYPIRRPGAERAAHQWIGRGLLCAHQKKEQQPKQTKRERGQRGEEWNVRPTDNNNNNKRFNHT